MIYCRFFAVQLFSVFTFGFVLVQLVSARSPYYFYSSISQETTLNYLSRTIHWTPPYNDVSLDKYVDRVGFDRFFSETVDLGAKMILQAENTWRNSSITPLDIARLQPILTQTHALDPEVIFNVFIAERVNKDYVNSISIPEYVFAAFDQPVVSRNFNYDLMFDNSWPYLDIWGQNNSPPDLTQLESQMWYYYYSTLYIDAGFESIWLGQIYVIAEHDSGYVATNTLVSKIREYARSHARRKYILVISHQLGDVAYAGSPIFDHLFYVTHFGLDSNGDMKAFLPSEFSINCDYYLDFCKYYQKHPLNHDIPLLLMFDNGGAMTDPYYPQLNGYDPITYFATRPKAKRNEYISRIEGELYQQYVGARFAPPVTMLATFTSDRRLCPDDNGVYRLPFANDYEALSCGDIEVVREYFNNFHFLTGDFDNNGVVNIFDYNTLVQDYGKIYSIFNYNNLVSNYPR